MTPRGAFSHLFLMSSHHICKLQLWISIKGLNKKSNLNEERTIFPFWVLLCSRCTNFCGSVFVYFFGAIIFEVDAQYFQFAWGNDNCILLHFGTIEAKFQNISDTNCLSISVIFTSCSKSNYPIIWELNMLFSVFIVHFILML